MTNLGLSICVSGYDTENIKRALNEAENRKLDIGNLISGLFTVMPKGSFESILVYVFKTGWMKAIVLAHIQKFLVSAGYKFRLNNIIVEEVRNQLEIYCEFGNVTIGDIYKMFLFLCERYRGICDIYIFYTDCGILLSCAMMNSPSNFSLC